MLITRFTRWEETSFDEYAKSCLEYGYNCESSPEFIDFMLRHNANLKFFSYRKNGAVLGSVCVDNGWLVNDYKNERKTIGFLPVPNSSIYIPFSKNLKDKIIIPFKSKCLHPLQENSFLNSSYGFLSKRKAAFVKDMTTGFSKKTISTRYREIRKFLRAGGEFRSINQLSADQFFEIYNELFYARRKKFVEEENINRIFFNEFHSHFKGDVMFMNNEPVAIQLLISVVSKVGFFVDFINIGYKQNESNNSLGTILMWKNLASVSYEAQAKEKELYYSYGFMSGDYKRRWCDPKPLGRIIC